MFREAQEGSGGVRTQSKQSSEFIRFSASQVLITRGFLGDLYLPCDTVQQSKCQKSGQRAALTSEKVHEVLSHVAVGREDLADAGGALGPWPAWWALDSVGHPLQQALTWKAPECGLRQQSPSAPSSQENRALGLPDNPSLYRCIGEALLASFVDLSPPPTSLMGLGPLLLWPYSPILTGAPELSWL